MEQIDFTLIERYHLNELSSDEMNRFNERLKTDEAFRKEFEELQSVFTAIKRSGENQLREKMNTWDEDLDSGTRVQVNRHWYLIAASLALILTVAIYLQSQMGTNDLYSEYYQSPGTPTISVRGERTAEMDLLEKSYAQFEAGDYSNASQGLEEYLNIVNDNQVRFFYAVSLMEQDDTELGIAIMEDVVDSSDEEEYQWYLGLYYLKLDREDDAKTLFEGLKASKEYGERAKEILKDL